MPAYDVTAIEKKWQDRWESERTFYVTEDPERTKFYNVQMYPYPSGDLHMGHLRNYGYLDLLTRYRRMQGFNVLAPMGWDSFGLPAENAAIQTGIHPRVFTEEQIARMKVQLRRLGAVYDWDRELASHTPEYYRWDQWLFLRLFERGLAYKKKSPVNWCPNDQTVLANEQVVDGRCERCGHEVEKRDLEQWFFRITDYADRLLADLDQLDRVARPGAHHAGELDRPLRGHDLHHGGRRDRAHLRGLHHQARHRVRDDFRRARPRAPSGQRVGRRDRVRGGGRAVRRRRRARRPRSSGWPRAARPAYSSGATPSTPSTAARCRSSSPTTC